MIISQIVAVDSHFGMGKDNSMPWHLPKDFAWFKEKTKGHCILMGRNTFESLGKPLPFRTNIVLTSQKDLKIEGVEIVNTLEEGIKLAESLNESELFIIGGANVFKQLSILNITDKLYLTKINSNFDCDVFYPENMTNGFHKTFSEFIGKDNKHLVDFEFQIWEK